jgi:anti-anti-sigma factor
MKAEYLPCTLAVYRDGNDLLVSASGSLVLATSENIKSRMHALMNGYVGALYFCIRELRDLDSAGLGLLVGLHMTSRKAKINFSLMSPNADHMHLLTATKLTSILSIVSGIEAETLRQRMERPDLAVSEPQPAELD